MSTSAVLSKILANEVAYAPTVASAVLIAESIAPDATGPEKASAVISAASQALATGPNANVANIAASVNLAVALANLLGIFKHKAK